MSRRSLPERGDREYCTYRCWDEQQRPEVETGACAAGRDPSEIGGASCKPEHNIASKGECTKCEESPVLPLIGVIALPLSGLSAMAVFAQAGRTRVKTNAASVAICMGQTVATLQAMSLFLTLKINWIELVQSVFEFFLDRNLQFLGAEPCARAL